MLRSLLDTLTTPSNFLMVLAILGLALMLLRWRKLGFSCTASGILGLLIFGYTSASELLIAPLVTRFPPVQLDTAPEPYGIIIMASGINEAHALHTGALLELTEDGDAIPIAALLARRYPDARIVVSSGSTLPEPLGPAYGIRRVLLEFGVAADRIVIDATSFDTTERVQNSISLIGNDRDKPWWVIASAHRLPRIMGVFRVQGFEPYPYPVDFRWIPPFDPFYTYPLTSGLKLTDAAAKEWRGLIFYWLKGNTRSVFPAP